MISALTFSLAAALLAQAVSARIHVDQGAAPSAAASVSEEQIGDPAVAMKPRVMQAGPTAARRVVSTQVAATARDATASGQVGVRARNTGSEQLTGRARTASAPPALSTHRDSTSVAVLVVRGYDRCDPVRGEATQQECAAILDNRAEQFAHPAEPQPTPEDVLINAPPSTNVASDPMAVARRLAGPGGGAPNAIADVAAVEATGASVQAASSTVGAADRTTPAIPAGVAAMLAGAGVTAPQGTVLTVTSPPK